MRRLVVALSLFGCALDGATDPRNLTADCNLVEDAVELVAIDCERSWPRRSCLLVVEELEDPRSRCLPALKVASCATFGEVWQTRCQVFAKLP
jgi:hypothetical protein